MLSEAHRAMSNLKCDGWEWAECERELKRAIELNPSNVDAHHDYSHFLQAMDRFPESLTAACARVQEVRRALPDEYGKWIAKTATVPSGASPIIGRRTNFSFGKFLCKKGIKKNIL